MLFWSDTNERLGLFGGIRVVNHATNIERNVVVITGFLKRREFLLIERPKAKEPRFTVGSSRLLDQDVSLSKHGKKAVDLVGPLDLIEIGVDPAVEVGEVRDGGMLANLLLEGLMITIAFLPEVGDELIVDGHELCEFNVGHGMCKDFSKDEIVGVDDETSDDAHRSVLFGLGMHGSQASVGSLDYCPGLGW